MAGLVGASRFSELWPPSPPPGDSLASVEQVEDKEPRMAAAGSEQAEDGVQLKSGCSCTLLISGNR